MVVKVLTANRLHDGLAVWLTKDETWAESLQVAVAARDAAAEEALSAVGRRDLAANLVVDVNLIEVEEREDGFWPLRLRERVRAAGPTIAYADGYGFADPGFVAA